MPRLEIASLRLQPAHFRTLQDLLARHVPDAEVWAYGSRVTGGAHEGSDLDLVLRNPADLTQDVEGRTGLMEALQASSLPMLVEAHAWALLPRAFHRNVEAGYVVLREPSAADRQSP